MKKLICMLLALVMVLSLAACGSSADGKSAAEEPKSDGESAAASDDKIVVWTLANDLKQFAERYTAETGREVEVVVFDSADYATKIMQTLGAQSKDLDIFVGEPC